MMRYRITAALLGTAVLLACGGDGAEDAPPIARDTMADTATMDTSAARAAGQEVFVAEAGPDATVVFVGEDSTMVPEGRAAAVFVPMSTFSVERDGIPNEFPPADSMTGLLEDAGVAGDRIVVVGEPIPAGRAFAALDYLGLGDRASILDGGPAALASASTPPADSAADTATTDTAAAAPGARASGPATAGLQTSVREDMIVDADWIHERLEDSTVAILDARPPEQYSGDTPGDGIDRPGHIPGARNVFWQTLVQSEADPRLKDEAELRRIFEEAGAAPGDTVVAYCRTGGQASFLYAVARQLGYDVRLYDGSYVDWSGTEYPVER
jgi:thiosulfate/3-mercaptopyruvate sulfurtransferase